MTKFEELYHKIASELPDMQESKMFGALCIKSPNGKSGVMFYKEDMVFKLPSEKEQEALALKGSVVFEPAAGRPMNGWVKVSNEHSAKWEKYAALAMEYVGKIEVVKKEKKTKK